MYLINEDNSIYATRGDIVSIKVTAQDNEKAYTFKAGDILRIKIFGKKDCETVVLQKDFAVAVDTESVDIFLNENDTKIGETISKPKDYWYEFELNPDTNPQTIVGYDDDGAKVFKLFPEGEDIIEDTPITPEDIPIVDEALDIFSDRPVENKAISKAIIGLKADIDSAETNANRLESEIAVERARINNLVTAETVDGELVDIRVGADGTSYETAGESVREQFIETNKKLSLLGNFEYDISGWKPVNVIDGYTWGNAGYTYDDYGNIISTAYTTKFTPLTELVTAMPNTSYQTSGFVGQIRIYSADKTQIELLKTEAMANQLSFTTSEDACYFGIYYRHDIINTEEMVAAVKLLRTTMIGTEYRDCPLVMVGGHISGEHINNETIGSNKFNNDARKFIKTLSGKTIVNFGDSVFGNARPAEDISTYIANLTGATVYNCGFGGCRMSHHPYANYDAFSMKKLADAIANNDFSVQDTAISNTSGDTLPDYFAESVAVLKSIDFSKVDIITIAYGANDFNGVRLETANNKLDIWSFAGALRYSIETILSAYPQIRIFICSPTYRFWMDNEYSFVEDSDTKRGGEGYLTTDIVAKAKEVANEYKLPFIDNYYSLGINKFNRTQYFPKTDGAHHNSNGRLLIASHIAKELF